MIPIGMGNEYVGGDDVERSCLIASTAALHGCDIDAASVELSACLAMHKAIAASRPQIVTLKLGVCAPYLAMKSGTVSLTLPQRSLRMKSFNVDDSCCNAMASSAMPKQWDPASPSSTAS